MRWFLWKNFGNLGYWFGAAALTAMSGWPLEGWGEIKVPARDAAITSIAPSGNEKAEHTAPAFPIAMRISSDAFVRRVNRDVHRVHKVDHMVLGTRAIGQAITDGKYEVSVIPCENRALFLMSLKGVSISKTVGSHEPVEIDTTCTTNFIARKLVAYDPENGFYAGPTQLFSQTHSVTDDVRTNRGLGRRIILQRARQQIEASRAEADEISRGYTEAEIRRCFDEAIADRLAGLNEEFDIQRLAHLLGRECQVCSTKTHVVLMFGKGGELPTLPEQTSKALIELCVHKSVVGEKLVGAVEKFDVLKNLLAIFQMPLRSSAPLQLAQSPNWVPGVDNHQDWIAIDLGQQGFGRVAKR